MIGQPSKAAVRRRLRRCGPQHTFGRKKRRRLTS